VFPKLKIGNGTVVVVSDATVLKEFMDKRSNETSGRPSFYTGSLITDGYFIAEADSSALFLPSSMLSNILPIVSDGYLAYWPKGVTDPLFPTGHE
jgi:hypothetical protein